MATPENDWLIPWQQQSHAQGLNNEEDFFSTRTYENYPGLGSNTTTIVNNRGGFFPIPPPQAPTVNQAPMATRVNAGNPFEKEEAFPRQQVGLFYLSVNIFMRNSYSSSIFQIFDQR